MERASLGAFGQLKVKYSSIKSDSQNSLIINGLPGSFHHGENFSELFDQVKIKQQLTANPQPWRQIPGLQRMSAARSRRCPGRDSSRHGRSTPSRPDAADLAAERQPCVGYRRLGPRCTGGVQAVRPRYRWRPLLQTELAAGRTNPQTPHCPTRSRAPRSFQFVA